MFIIHCSISQETFVPNFHINVLKKKKQQQNKNIFE